TRYSDEVWTGIEYEVAGLLLASGGYEDALRLLAAIRNRYDGRRMNPWNDIECGDHYVRAMSSWSLLITATNFGWDAHLGQITLGNRLGPSELVAPFFAAPAWGQFTYSVKGNQTTVTIQPSTGEIEIKSVLLPDLKNAHSVLVTH